MGTEDAGELSVAAIAHCLACWDDAAPLDAAIPAARAELAAIRVAAQRAGALAAALRRNLERHMGKHGYCPLCRSQDDEPHADWCAGFALGAFDADTGPGAAGARDEPMSFAAFVAWLAREGLSICAREEFDTDRRMAGRAPGGLRPLEATAVLERRLDAPRVGGAGS